MRCKNLSALAAITAGMMLLRTAEASEMSYTFMDFQALNSSVDATGLQTPVPLQTVGVEAGNGSGVAVGGSVAAGDHFYVSALYRSSIVDVRAIVSSPLATEPVEDTFDLTQARFALGYLYPIGDSLDLIAEVSYDSANYDFGSFAGEDFDTDDSGIGAQIGFRWNPMRALEVFAFGRHSPVAKSNLSTRELASDTVVNAGLRWYFLEDLGIGLEYESGEVATTMISMRFNFGNLPW